MLSIYKKITMGCFYMAFTAAGHFAHAQQVLETGSQKPMPDEWIDKDTGHKIIRLTRRDGSNGSFYFNNYCFVPQKHNEGDEMVFSGSTDHGNQLFKVNLKTLHIQQLTNKTKGAGGEMICPKTREAFYQSGDSVFAVSVDTKKTRFIYAFPPNFGARAASVNADGTYLACSKAEEAQREIFKKYPAKADFFPRIYDAHLLNTIYTINIKTKELKNIHEEHTWLGHLLFSPTDPNTLSYCHEGPWEKVDRIWNYNIKTGETKLMHKRTMENEIAGHEFFSPDGKIEWYDLQKPKGQTFFLAGLNEKTGAKTIYQMTGDEWSIHFNVAHNGTFFAGDGGDATQVAKAKDGMWIYVFRPDGDHFKSEKLVNMKAHGYRKLEPNVHISPDDKWVIFGGNFDGRKEAYAVEIAKSK